MKRKILLAVTLLVLLLAISYIKSVRGDSSRQASLLEGQEKSSRLLQSKENQIDSLRVVAGNLELAMADSLTKQRQSHQRDVDSLARTIEASNTQIEKLKQAQKKPATKKKSTATKPKNPTLEKHKSILKYYRKRYIDLPVDLSDYERKVALNEIREDTAKRFKITLSELRSIRTKNKLGY